MELQNSSLPLPQLKSRCVGIIKARWRVGISRLVACDRQRAVLKLVKAQARLADILPRRAIHNRRDKLFGSDVFAQRKIAGVPDVRIHIAKIKRFARDHKRARAHPAVILSAALPFALKRVRIRFRFAEG